MTSPQRLTADNWITAGLARLKAAGIESVRVEPLAEDLKVTKGSFYWHFKDRAALLAAMLEAWKARATAAVIRQVEDEASDPYERLRRLISIVSENDGRLERAIRNWAAHDPAAQAAMAEIDGTRLAYVARLFEALGIGRADAMARARFSYQALIGQYQADDGLGAHARVRERVEMILPLLAKT